MNDRAVTAVALVALLLVSSAIAFSFSLSSPGIGGRTTNMTQSVGPDNDTGLVRLVSELQIISSPTPVYYVNFTGSGANTTGGFGTITSYPITVYPQGIPPLNFTISSDEPAKGPYNVVLGQPGEVDVHVLPGAYTVRTRGPYYNVTAPIQVTPGGETEVLMNVTQTYFYPQSLHFADPDRSGYAAPWTTLAVELSFPVTAPEQGSVVFIDYTRVSSGYNYTCPVTGYYCGVVMEVGSVLSKVQLSDNRASGVWLMLAPTQQIPLQDLSTVDLYTVAAGSQVISNGP